MKANELKNGNGLMVGNLINIDDCLTEITGITKSTVFFNDGFQMFIAGGIEPIPLTEDWLLKAGFEVVYDSEFTKRLDFIKDNRFDFFINKQNETISGIRFKGNTFFNEVKHVHQLQNLYFVLTGEELLIKDQNDN